MSAQEKVIDLMEALKASLAQRDDEAPAADLPVDERDITPGVGLWPGVPYDDYSRWRACSNSRLSRLMRTPAHAKAYMDGELDGEETPAQVFGRASHTAILEPDCLDERYVVSEPCCAEIKTGARKGQRCGAASRTLAGDGSWLCGSHDRGITHSLDRRREVISGEDYNRCLALRDAVHGHPRVARLLSLGGDAEVSGVWTDAETGLLMKMRADFLCRSKGVCLDLKTARDASPAEFEHAIFTLGYHRQGGLYLEGLNTLEPGEWEHFVIVAVEKEPPWAVAAYRLRDDAIAAGIYQLESLKRRYRECAESGVWPAYGDDITDIALPPWAWEKVYG